MASRSSFATRALAVLLLAAPAAAGEPVLDFSAPAPAGFVFANLGVSPKVVPGAPGERALELALEATPDGWTELDFAFVEHYLKSDWSGYAAAELDIENRGEEPLVVGLRLRNTAASDAEGAMAAFSAELAPGSRGRLRVPLLALRFGQGFGAWPAQGPFTSVESDGRASPRRIVETGVFFDTSKPRRVRLRRLELVEPLPKGPWIDAKGRSKLSPRADADAYEAGRRDAWMLANYKAPEGRDELGASTVEPAFASRRFFGLERRDGRWWLVAPSGRPFFASCLGGVYAGIQPRWDDARKAAHAWLPPRKGEYADAWLDGKAPSLYRANLIRKWKSGIDERFLLLARARLTAWGFTCLGPWSDDRVADAAPVPYFSEGPDAVEGPALDDEPAPSSVPDPWAPGFAAAAEKAAAPLAELKDEPLIVGHFFDEELSWERAADFLYGKEKTLHEAAARYCEVMAGAIRKADPNHLLFGPRFSTGASSSTVAEITAACAPFVDVLTYDDFRPEPVKGPAGKARFTAAYAYNTTADGALTATAPVASREERGVGLAYYLGSCAADPDCVGASWYQYLDEPLLGRADGDTSLNGLVDVADLPYIEVVEAARKANEAVYEMRRGRIPKPETRPRR